MTVPEAVLSLIEGSGNSFHAKVARWFESRGWSTVISPYYLDQTQGKAREIDLVAEKSWPVRNSLDHPEGDLVVRLFVECKYIPSEMVFWFTPKNTAAAMELVCSSGVFYESHSYTQDHHYLATSPKVAKLFASNNSKAAENEPIYKALNQVLNGFVAMGWRATPLLPPARRSRNIVGQLNFPVIICNSFSQGFAVDFFKDSPPERLGDNFQLEVRYAYALQDGSAREDYFLVDCVDFSRLAEFEAAIDRGASAGAALAASS